MLRRWLVFGDLTLAAAKKNFARGQKNFVRASYYSPPRRRGRIVAPETGNDDDPGSLSPTIGSDGGVLTVSPTGISEAQRRKFYIGREILKVSMQAAKEMSDRGGESMGSGTVGEQEMVSGSHRLRTTDTVDEDYSKDWQAFGKSFEMPPLVKKIMQDVKGLESDLGEKLIFGGPRGSLQGRAKVEEEHKHRSFYGHISNAEQKLQFFTARQVACRILGSKGYLCEHCWLPLPDCICQRIAPKSLWPGVQLWLYMHPKDYLRKNNSGKLLWQVFGTEAARFCIYGIQEHEDAMWDAFKQAGQAFVWCVYPERSPADYHVDELFIPEDFVQQMGEESMGNRQPVFNFVLIDGTWNNSKAMVSRLQDRAKATWDGQYIRCVALCPERLSVMHGLRPQPSLDRTCTAAAAAQLLRELDLRKDLIGCDLDKAADALEDALQHLLDALATRRKRVGRASIRIKKQ